MALSDLWTVYAIKIDPDVLAGAVTLGGISNDNLRSGNDIAQEPSSGQPYAHFQQLRSISPGASFSTYALATALGACGLTGLKIAATSLTGITLYAYAKSEGGLRKSGANHASFNVKEGILFPRRIRLPHRGLASIDYELLATFDGTNDPVVMATGISVPTPPTDSERFGMGAVQLGTIDGNKITLGQKTDVEIDLGVAAFAESSDSDIYPTLAGIETIQPMLSITTYDVSKLVSSGGVALTGKQLAAAKTIILIRRLVTAGSNTTGFVADGTATHISVTPYAGCAWHDTIMEGRSGGHRTATIRGALLGDASNPPLAFGLTATNALT